MKNDLITMLIAAVGAGIAFYFLMLAIYLGGGFRELLERMQTLLF